MRPREEKGAPPRTRLSLTWQGKGICHGYKDLKDTLGGHQTDPKPEVVKPNLSALSQLFAKLSPSSASDESQQTLCLCQDFRIWYRKI
eukprot:scaffold247817_cov28-Attheya_sp.AAC.1